MHILHGLIVADGMKNICFKYVGQKRFSLEGGDEFPCLIPLCIAAKTDQRNGDWHGAPRPLNVLINILGKESAAILQNGRKKHK